MSYLPYLCLFAYSDIEHILCCVFVCLFVFFLFACLLLVYHMTSVSLDCPLLIAPSVLSLVYLVQTTWFLGKKNIYKVRSKSKEWKANNLKIYRRKKAKGPKYVDDTYRLNINILSNSVRLCINRVNVVYKYGLYLR